MGRPGRKPSFYTKYPEFFKVYLPDFSSQHMCIPPVVVQKLNGNIPKNANLRDFSGKCWPVVLEEFENHLYMKNGWQEFATDHCLELGDWLEFRLCPNSLFYVKIFGRDGWKKEELLERNPDGANVKQGKETEAEQTCPEPTSTCIRKRKYSNSNIRRNKRSAASSKAGQCQTKESNTPNSEERQAVKEAKSAAVRNPYFVAPITASSRYNSYIPRWVTEMNNIKLDTQSELWDQNGKLWPVKVLLMADRRFALGKGWVNFLNENKLKVNDKCVFEFVLGEGRTCKEMLVRIVSQGPKTRRRYRNHILKRRRL